MKKSADIILLQKMIDEVDNIVFFGGAGVSTESGLKDFRSVDGLYNLNYKYPPEEILSHDFFYENPYEFYRFYKDKILVEGIKPNIAHYQLAKMEQIGKLKGLITQNIDNLHYLAGSKNVIELHGSIMHNHCISCNKYFAGYDFILKNNHLPLCDECHNLIKPDVVLYGESLNEDNIIKAIELISNAKMLIVGGSSLSVYPAAGFVSYFKGKYLVVINKTHLPSLQKVTLEINEPIGEVFSKIDL